MPNPNNDTVPVTPDDIGKWHTMDDACKVLGISKRTLWRRIDQGKLESKLEDGRRLVLVTEEIHGTVDTVPNTSNGTIDGTIDTADGTVGTGEVAQLALIDQLSSEVDYLRKQLEDTKERDQARIKELEQQIAETRKVAADASQRSDTIILQLTRQLENQQKLLEYKEEPWWRRWFRRDKESDSS